MENTTLTLTCLLLSLCFLLANGHKPGLFKCEDYEGEAWDKAHVEKLMFADNLKQAADTIYYYYFKGMLDLMKDTQSGCLNPDDIEVQAAVNGYSDILDKWQHPKLMGLPSLDEFPQ